MAFIKRSVSPSTCTFVNGDYNQNVSMIDKYDHHEIRPIAFVADLLIWGLVASLVFWWLDNRRRRLDD
jgi:hypothetical protein